MDLFNYQEFSASDKDAENSVYKETDDIDISIGLNQLTLDERVRLAERGKKSDLDILIDDPDYRVRELVANHGYAGHLNQLVSDPSSYVRGEVASHNRDKDLKKLSNDEDASIRHYVEQIKSEKS